jgi:hypothetical protein
MFRQLMVPEHGAVQELRLLDGELIECRDGI